MTTNAAPTSERRYKPQDLLPDKYKYHSIAHISKFQNRTEDNFLFEYGIYFYKRLLELYEECDVLKRQVLMSTSNGKDKQVHE